MRKSAGDTEEVEAVVLESTGCAEGDLGIKRAREIPIVALADKTAARHGP